MTGRTSERDRSSTDDSARVALTAAAIAMGAGVFGAIQPEINSELGSRLGSSLVAAFINFGVAFLVALLVLSRRPSTRHHLSRMSAWPVPWWTFTAGLGGVVVVVAGVVTVERLGVAIFSIAFFAGQMSFGLVVDRLGIGPGGQRPVTATRVGAAALAVAAVVLSQVGQPTGEPAPAAIAFVVVAGAASAVQSAFNGRIAATLGDALAPTVVNVTLGTSCLGLFVAVAAVTGSIGPLDWPSEPWLYAGGVLGVTIVLSLAAATAAVGVLRTTVAMLAAQLFAAFAVDWLVRDDPPTAGVIAGALLIVVAVLVVNRRPSYSRISTTPSP